MTKQFPPYASEDDCNNGWPEASGSCLKYNMIDIAIGSFIPLKNHFKTDHYVGGFHVKANVSQPVS